jgi:cytochrome P450
MNPDIFPDPFTFKPERWLNNKELQKYQVTFGKGRRGCLGKK